MGRCSAKGSGLTAPPPSGNQSGCLGPIGTRFEAALSEPSATVPATIASPICAYAAISVPTRCRASRSRRSPSAAKLRSVTKHCNWSYTWSHRTATRARRDPSTASKWRDPEGPPVLIPRSTPTSRQPGASRETSAPHTTTRGGLAPNPTIACCPPACSPSATPPPSNFS